jgi:hypothetical protein
MLALPCYFEWVCMLILQSLFCSVNRRVKVCHGVAFLLACMPPAIIVGGRGSSNQILMPGWVVPSMGVGMHLYATSFNGRIVAG